VSTFVFSFCCLKIYHAFIQFNCVICFFARMNSFPNYGCDIIVRFVCSFVVVSVLCKVLEGKFVLAIFVHVAPPFVRLC
jgi:hypothetical protein